MDTLTNQFENLYITENSLLWKDLSAERGFADEVEERLNPIQDRLFRGCSWIGRGCQKGTPP